MDYRLAILAIILLSSLVLFQYQGVPEHKVAFYIVTEKEYPNNISVELLHYLRYYSDWTITSGVGGAITLDGEIIASFRKAYHHDIYEPVAERWNIDVSDLDIGWHEVCFYGLISHTWDGHDDWSICEKDDVWDWESLRYIDYAVRDVLKNVYGCTCTGRGWSGLQCPAGVGYGTGVVYAVEHNAYRSDQLAGVKICRQFYYPINKTPPTPPPQPQPAFWTPLIALIIAGSIGYYLLSKKGR